MCKTNNTRTRGKTYVKQTNQSRKEYKRIAECVYCVGPSACMSVLQRHISEYTTSPSARSENAPIRSIRRYLIFFSFRCTRGTSKKIFFFLHFLALLPSFPERGRSAQLKVFLSYWVYWIFHLFVLFIWLYSCLNWPQTSPLHLVNNLVVFDHNVVPE